MSIISQLAYYLQGGVAVVIQQDLDDAHMTLVDGNMQGGLVTTVTSIKVSSGLR